MIGDERHHLLSHSDVHQVVAKGEIEQFALPNLLAGEVLFIFLRRDVGHIHGLHALGGVLMLDAIGLPYSIDAHGQGADAFQTAAVDIAEEHETVFIGHDVILRMTHGIFESHVA